MTFLLPTLLRVSLVLGGALLAMPLLSGRSAVARRLVLSAALACALVVPFLPAWHLQGPTYRAVVAKLVAEPHVAAATAQVSAAATQTSPARAVTGSDVLALTWALGALAAAARFGAGLLLARGLVHRSTIPASWSAAIARAERETGLRAVVRTSEEIVAPAVTGAFSPVVLVPPSSASWSDERKHVVLLHELAHVGAYDLHVQALAAIVTSLYWFHPLAWLAARRLRLERELAADEAVLRAGTRASSYAEDLLAIAGAAPAGTIAIGEKPLPKRITAIVSARRPRVVSREAGAALVVGTSALATLVACSTASEPAAPAIVTARAVDTDLQAIADRELARAVSENKARGGSILVLSPRGEVLAEAGGQTDTSYVAGSTMKAFLLAGALEAGVVKETDVLDCGPAKRSGKEMHDATALGRAALPEVLAASSNVGFAQIFDRLGGAGLDRTLRGFHFSPPGALASAPAGDWDAGLLAIGATMSTTPRQVARAYATLANGGDGVVSAQTAQRTTALLEGVVASEKGTGKKAQVPGVRVAGKTSTSEWTDANGVAQTYASFVGYVPAESPRFVIFVGVASPSVPQAWGGTVAAPVFARVATAALAR